MTAEVTTLENGVRVVTQRMDHVETLALGLWIGSGARQETVAEHGISHLLEHMAFKGTTRRSARDIAEEIEGVGGDLNAATSLESTSYYVRILKDDMALALDILADITQQPRFREDELEREKDVILQEIAGIQDNPEEVAFDLAQALAFPGQAVGRPIIGTADSVLAQSSAGLRSFLARQYLGRRAVLAAAGAVHHEDMVRHARALFGGLSAGELAADEPALFGGGAGGSPRLFEQAHMLVGLEGFSYRDPDFYAAQVYSGLIGGGMSSRLFQEAREERGLCYAIYSTAWGFSDGGMFSVYAATGHEMVEPLAGLVGEELHRCAAEAPTAAEVQRAKAQLKAGLMMSLESCAARTEQIARQMLYFDRVLPIAEMIDRVDEVDSNRVRDVAQRIIGSKAAVVAVVGSGQASHEQAEIARRLIVG